MTRPFAILLVVCACSGPEGSRASSEQVPSAPGYEWEGFFPPEAVTQPWLDDRGIPLSAEAVARVLVVDDEPAWRGVILAHPFLGTYDSINGYSGGPVFDSRGRLIGVNSTLVGSSDPQERYGDDFRAVATPARRALERLEAEAAEARGAP